MGGSIFCCLSYYKYKGPILITAKSSSNMNNYSSVSNTTDYMYFDYTLFDISFRNYIRLLESLKQRLVAGLGVSLSYDNQLLNLNDIPPVDDIPQFGLLISGSLRYDIAIGSFEMISIEPYYNYEGRSVARTYPRLASLGVKLSLLFN